MRRNEALKQVRERHFSARTPATKQKYREKDKELRDELANLLERDGFNPRETKLWTEILMIKINLLGSLIPNGCLVYSMEFYIMNRNPPYGIVYDKKFKKLYESKYLTFKRNNDIYVAFFEQSLNLLFDSGILCLITPNTYLNGDYFKLLRKHHKQNSIIREICPTLKIPRYSNISNRLCKYYISSKNNKY